MWIIQKGVLTAWVLSSHLARLFSKVRVSQERSLYRVSPKAMPTCGRYTGFSLKRKKVTGMPDTEEFPTTCHFVLRADTPHNPLTLCFPTFVFWIYSQRSSEPSKPGEAHPHPRPRPPPSPAGPRFSRASASLEETGRWAEGRRGRGDGTASHFYIYELKVGKERIKMGKEFTQRGNSFLL